MCYSWGTQLFSSPHRLEVLRTLESEPADTRELTDALSASRVTVQRHLNQCRDLEWVEKTDGHYELTPIGDAVCRAATDFCERLSMVEEHEQAVRTLSKLDDSFDPRLLTDATISVADPNSPHEPLTHYRNAMASTSTSSIRGILPVFSELLTEVHGDLLAAGVETELLVPHHVLEAAPPVDVPASVFTLRVLEQPRKLEFAVTLTDEAAFVGGYDDGTFLACIESEDPAFREWVATVYEDYRERSTHVPLEDASERDSAS
ncbi:ArsR family transcriptional regulator [Halobacteria archaeon AArc-m2/3/4]|uniref:ArsR family transcriptional regulator n=1 Tax=Natronoglomus mannanivorans TaxID=2979990 RepID=A0AAP3E3W1_9EURY|nr:ArsR family transcriptional regulator [Halobacteria archaeon AArc-xg1-1]MCU4974341.1 ArsR family transcriptional regulator [Halobacteria archaeon AArc-m2/3/4]